jgi:hypothetical protein
MSLYELPRFPPIFLFFLFSTHALEHFRSLSSNTSNPNSKHTPTANRISYNHSINQQSRQNEDFEPVSNSVVEFLIRNGGLTLVVQRHRCFCTCCTKELLPIKPTISMAIVSHSLMSSFETECNVSLPGKRDPIKCWSSGNKSKLPTPTTNAE